MLNPDRGGDREGPTEEARGPITGLEGEIGWIWASGLAMECMAGPVMLPEIGKRADLEEETFRFGPGDLGVVLEEPRGIKNSGEPPVSRFGSPCRQVGQLWEWTGHLGAHRMRVSNSCPDLVPKGQELRCLSWSHFWKV